MASTNKSVSITILYDNDSLVKGLQSDWGFSCLIKGTEKTILFDTGGNGEILLSNMKKLRIDSKDVEIVFLSHIHGDHTEGLSNFLEINPNVSVYVPISFPDNFKKKVKSYGAKLVEVSKQTEICKGVFSTGELGTSVKEQSLVIKTEKGLVVIPGCAHPGIVNIARNATENISRNIYFVMGGFHLLAYSPRGIKEIILGFKELGVKKVGPCHCSGDTAKRLFREEYGENFVKIGVGKVIEIK